MGISCELVSRGKIFVHPHSDPYARDADRNFNHAPSVVLMPDGRLLCMWFSAPWEGHHWQALMQSYSTDGGSTWSKAEVFQDTHGQPDFDPAFIRKGNRVWLFFAYAPRYAKLFGERTGRLGCFARYTDDNGKSWSEIVKLCEPEGPRTNGIVLRDGSLAIGVHAEWAFLLKSSDDGKSWRKCGWITTPFLTHEPTVAQLNDDSLLMYLRTRSGYIWQTRSFDCGETWTIPEQTDIVANLSSHCLYRLRDGRVALAYNPCAPELRTPLVLRLSDDEALCAPKGSPRRSENARWSEPFVVDEIALSEGSSGRCAVTYPSLTENSQGELVMVWARYWITSREHCGDICFARLRV